MFILRIVINSNSRANYENENFWTHCWKNYVSKHKKKCWPKPNKAISVSVDVLYLVDLSDWHYQRYLINGWSNLIDQLFLSHSQRIRQHITNREEGFYCTHIAEAKRKAEKRKTDRQLCTQVSANRKEGKKHNNVLSHALGMCILEWHCKVASRYNFPDLSKIWLWSLIDLCKKPCFRHYMTIKIIWTLNIILGSYKLGRIIIISTQLKLRYWCKWKGTCLLEIYCNYLDLPNSMGWYQM